jgi:hypothetical protein
VQHVPSINKNLVSGSLLCRDGFKVVFESNKFVVSKCKQFIGNKSVNNICDGINESDASIWHSCLCHLNSDSMPQLSSLNLILNLSNVKGSKCQSCVQFKQPQKPHKAVEERHLTPLELIHPDICKMNGVLTEGGQRYFMTMIDDATRYCYVYLLKTKDEALNCFKPYKAKAKNQLEKKIKHFRSYRGGEYFSNEFNLFYMEHVVTHERTPPYSPQSNGVAERKNHTLSDLVNFMLNTAELSKPWWGQLY